MKILWLVIIVGLIVGGGVWYANRSEDESAVPIAETTQTESSAETSASETPAKSEASTDTAAGAYVDYSSSVIASTTGTKILFFHAPWCPQCRALDADIKKSALPSGVTIIKTDYDSNQQLRKKYGVTIQTTLIRVDDQGNLVEKYVAYDQPNFAAVKANLL